MNVEPALIRLIVPATAAEPGVAAQSNKTKTERSFGGTAASSSYYFENSRTVELCQCDCCRIVVMRRSSLPVVPEASEGCSCAPEVPARVSKRPGKKARIEVARFADMLSAM